MVTNITPLINKRASLLLLMVLMPLMLLLELQSVNGVTVTWGQVNKYASTLHAQDVYLPRADNADVNGAEDVVFYLKTSTDTNGYTITAVHAYDLTSLDENGGDGGAAILMSGGVGQQHATVRIKRHATVDKLHFLLVIYGVEQ